MNIEWNAFLMWVHLDYLISILFINCVVTSFIYIVVIRVACNVMNQLQSEVLRCKVLDISAHTS